MNYGSVHISHIWCVIFWRGDRQCFLPCGPVTFQYMFYFWLISVSEPATARVFVSLMISHHLEVKLNKNSRQAETSLSDNAKKQSNTMLSLMATKKLLIALQEVPWFSPKNLKYCLDWNIFSHLFVFVFNWIKCNYDQFPENKRKIITNYVLLT